MARAGRKKPVRYYSPKRRAVYAKGDCIPALVLFELYGWTCYLCKEPIDRRRRCPDWRAGTIEHIIPLAKGGTHTWDNVVPAHLRCNELKGEMSYADYRPVTSLVPAQDLRKQGLDKTP